MFFASKYAYVPKTATEANATEHIAEVDVDLDQRAAVEAQILQQPAPSSAAMPAMMMPTSSAAAPSSEQQSSSEFYRHHHAYRESDRGRDREHERERDSRDWRRRDDRDRDDDRRGRRELSDDRRRCRSRSPDRASSRTTQPPPPPHHLPQQPQFYNPPSLGQQQHAQMQQQQAQLQALYQQQQAMHQSHAQSTGMFSFGMPGQAPTPQGYSLFGSSAPTTTPTTTTGFSFSIPQTATYSPSSPSFGPSMLGAYPSMPQPTSGSNAVGGSFQFAQPQPLPKVRKVRKADTNVISIALGSLAENVQMVTGDPVFCKGCSAVLNASSVTKRSSESNEESGDKGKDKQEEGAGELVWKCEFCDTVNTVNIEEEEMPTAETQDYLLEPPAKIESTEDDQPVLFIIDISGSMCVTTEVPGRLALRGNKESADSHRLLAQGVDQYMPGQRRDVTYVSRLQCVQAAVSHQLRELRKKHPKRRVGLISFNDQVTIIGDGSEVEPIHITGDKLDDYTEILDSVSKKSSALLRRPIEETADSLETKLFALTETGSTALGPAVLAAIALAGSNATLIICTDGLANVGLGNMESDSTAAVEAAEGFYRRAAEEAKSRGITISTVSIRGSDCRIENLGLMSDITSGDVDIVDPTNLTLNFESILEKPTIAKDVYVKFMLHTGLYVRQQETTDVAPMIITASTTSDASSSGSTSETNAEDAKKAEEFTNFVEREFGTVNADSDITFEYGFRAGVREKLAQLAEAEQDKTSETKSGEEKSGGVALPFQVQIRYTRLDGAKCVRIITKQQLLTTEREKAEKEVDVSVLGLHAVQQCADLAHRGDYESSRAVMASNQQLLNRAAEASGQQQQYGRWLSHANDFDRELRHAQRSERSRGIQRDGARSQDRDRDRHRERSDDAARAIYRGRRAGRSRFT